MVVALAVGCGGTASDAPPIDTLSSAAQAMGTPSALDSLGPFFVYASGTLNKTAEGQGFTPSDPAPAPLTEITGVDPIGDAALWEYREERFDGTHEHFGESYPFASLSYQFAYDVGVAVPIRGSGFESERARIQRRIPHLLLEEMRTRPTRLRPLESDGVTRVAGTLRDGTEITLSIDPATSLVVGLEYDTTLPARGA